MKQLGRILRRSAATVGALVALIVSLESGAVLLSEKPAAPRTSAVPTDSEREWRLFVKRAEEELLETPPVAPPPEAPTLPAPRTPVIRLTEAGLRPASDEKSNLPSDGVVLALGPFRSDRAAQNMKPGRVRGGDSPATTMTFTGFALDRDKVGAIVIELRQPFGDAFLLQWTLAGQVLVPIPDNERFWSIRIDTEGLPDWSGTLRSLFLVVKGQGSGAVEVRRIEFLRRTAAFAERAGVRRVAASGELRTAAYVKCPGAAALGPVNLPRRARLALGLAAVGDSDAAPTLELSVESGDKKEAVVTRAVAAGGAWHDVGVDLSEWAGREVLLTLACRAEKPGAVALWGDPVVYEPVKDAPLFIVYVIDAVGANRVNLNGASRPTMPHLEKLTARGAWFDPVFANAPRTVESVPSLLYSLTGQQHGVQQPSMRIAGELVGLPEVLQSAGFATAFFCTNPNAGVLQGMDAGFDVFFERYSYFYRGAPSDSVNPEEILAWLDAHRDRPAFVYIHTVEPHSPYEPPEGFRGRFDPKYDGPFNGSLDPVRGFQRARLPQDIAHVAALHDEEILFADAQLGRLVNGMARRGLLDRANIFVTADHGEEFFEHGFWEHGLSLHDPALRIPLVAVGPMVAARGRVQGPVQLVDLTPTILDLLDLPAPYPLAGESFAPLLRAEKSDRAAERTRGRPVFLTNHQFRKDETFELGVIDAGQRKLVLRYIDRKRSPEMTRFQLFDLTADPAEERDLLQVQRERARRLIDALVDHHRQQATFRGRSDAEPRPIDSEELERLKSLGYIK